MSKNKLQIFNYEANEVRTVEKNGEPWFVLKDVCKILEIKNHKDIVGRLDTDEVGRFNLPHPQNEKRKIEITVINESGLYSVILRSDKPQAKPFRKWVTSEVLPSIRKTGSYLVKNDNSTLKEEMLKTRVENVKVRKAQLMYKLSQEVSIPTYKQVLQSHITELLTGQMLLPLPQLAERTYSAQDIADQLGISAQKVGRLTNQYGLKTDEYGEWVWDKAKGHDKQVQSFRYFGNIINMLSTIISEVA